ncbi:MAG TPA: YcxB family protein [Candidatus Acidoferrales bacterium]|nr:YcxB family protein [Candidatus Acidoferrales bacterium]
MTAKFAYTAEDYSESQVFYRKRLASWSQRYNPKFIAVGGVLMACLGVVMFFAHSDKFLAVVCAAFGVYLALWYAPSYRWRRAKVAFSDECAITIDEKEMQFSSPNAQSRYQWPAFYRWAETPNLFLVFLHSKHFYIVPKRIFSPADLETARKILTEGIGSAEA